MVGIIQKRIAVVRHVQTVAPFVTSNLSPNNLRNENSHPRLILFLTLYFKPTPSGMFGPAKVFPLPGATVTPNPIKI